jgi:uncharacterized protein (TIGR03067 family)
MRSGLFAVSLAVLLVPAVLAADEKNDKEKLQGGWTAVAIEVEGTKLPPDLLKMVAIKIKFDGDKVIQTSMGKSMEGNLTLNSSKDPKEFEVTINGKPTKGIYMLDGTKLTICLGDADRPTAFATKPNSKSALMVFEKDK